MQEALPYDAGTLRIRLSGNNAAELAEMQEALSQRARELTAEIIALDAPDCEYPGAAFSAAVCIRLFRINASGRGATPCV